MAESTTDAPPVGSAGAEDVPYYYQYGNSRHPSASCQNTALAMVLSYYGAVVTPDQITDRFGKDKAQSPAGLAEIFNHYASEAGIPERMEATTQGSLEELRTLAAGPDPVIVHGYFTGGGHVVAVTDYDGSSYTVSDPAGTWSQTHGGGYPKSWTEPRAGDGITYGQSAFEHAVSTNAHGSAHAPLWYSQIVRP